MIVGSACNKNVEIVGPDTPLDKVAHRMRDQNCGAILVGQDDRLTGIITDRDIVTRCVAAGADPVVMTAGECQTPKVLYCCADDAVEDVLHDMGRNAVRRMVVLDDRKSKRMVGIVSLGDLASACADKAAVGEAEEQICKAVA
jgi:CBS domain-containing protein